MDRKKIEETKAEIAALDNEVEAVIAEPAPAPVLSVVSTPASEPEKTYTEEEVRETVANAVALALAAAQPQVKAPWWHRALTVVGSVLAVGGAVAGGIAIARWANNPAVPEYDQQQHQQAA